MSPGKVVRNGKWVFAPISDASLSAASAITGGPSWASRLDIAGGSSTPPARANAAAPTAIEAPRPATKPRKRPSSALFKAASDISLDSVSQVLSSETWAFRGGGSVPSITSAAACAACASICGLGSSVSKARTRAANCSWKEASGSSACPNSGLAESSWQGSSCQWSTGASTSCVSSLVHEVFGSEWCSSKWSCSGK